MNKLIIQKMRTICLVLLHCCFVSQLLAQQTPAVQRLTVTGMVVSSETKMPMTGVTVGIAGTRKGVVTDSLGKYSIRLDKGQTLEFTYVGFDKYQYKPTQSGSVGVEMKMRILDNEEVVVIGYGTVKKSHLTGAVAKVTNTNMNEIPVGRADLALMGKLSGVNIQMTDAQAGAAPTIQVRGATSVTAGTNPLIVIDGYPVPTDLSAIDMNDVESIEVLKDAASAAIYGSRGGNGVILITSKSGKAGRAKVSLNASAGLRKTYRYLNMYNLEDWKLQTQLDNNGVVSDQITQAERFNANTDAQKVVFHTGKYDNVQLGISGSTPVIKYYLSGTALIEDGVMIGNNNKRFNMKGSFEAKPTSKLTVNVSFNPSYNVTTNIPVTVQEAFRTLPNWMPLYHTDTSAKYTGKPVGSIANTKDFDPGRNLAYTGGVSLSSATTNSGLAQLEGTTDQTTQIRNITSFGIKYDFNKAFSFKTTGGVFTSSNTRELFQKSWAQADPVVDGEDYARSTSKAIYTQTKVLDLLNENTLSWKQTYHKHDLSAVGGFTAQYTSTDFLSGQAGNFATDEIPTLNAGRMQSLTSNKQAETLISFLFRANYAYDGKYLVSVSARQDGSSRFGPDNRWGFFPSASLGWRLSRESFFPDNIIVNDVKLRASYGATGNKNIGNYRYIANVSPTYTVLGNDVAPSMQLTTFGNTDLKWERTFSTNLGADLSFFNNRLTLTLDYYDTKTDRLLLDLPIAAASGFTTYPTNIGKVGNKGFEFEITTRLLTKKNFKWDISANGYTNKNTLLDFGGAKQQINQGDPKRANFFLSQVGQPLVQYYGYQADSAVSIRNTNYWPIGVTSIHSFVRDANGDKRISDSDRVVLGNPYPKFNWGFTNNFQYKNFDISITLQGSHGAKVFNIDPYYFETQFGTTGTTAYQYQGYTDAQKDRLRQKFQTDANIQDASFIALRNLNVGFAVPSKTAKKWKLQRVRFYMSAANLWYRFADSYTSFNPEADNGFPDDPLRKGYQRGGAPLARSITFGLNLDF
jgi:TonB-linked SusC/RagA family outer membrane protein